MDFSWLLDWLWQNYGFVAGLLLGGGMGSALGGAIVHSVKKRGVGKMNRMEKSLFSIDWHVTNEIIDELKEIRKLLQAQSKLEMSENAKEEKKGVICYKPS